MTPSAFGYVSVPPSLDPDQGEAALQAWTHELAHLAARTEYGFAGVFADMRGQTETGLYRLLEVLRSDAGVAVLVPDLDHLHHAGCLSGADPRTAARYLRARLLMASDSNPAAGHDVTPPREALDLHATRPSSAHTPPSTGQHTGPVTDGITSVR